MTQVDLEGSRVLKKTVHFPPEVLAEIFMVFVSPPSKTFPAPSVSKAIRILQSQLASCALVNRTWNLAATSLLYRHVLIRDENDRLFLPSSHHRVLRSLSSVSVGPISWTWKEPCVFPSLVELGGIHIINWEVDGTVDLSSSCPILEGLSLALPSKMWALEDRETHLTLPPTLTWLQINAQSDSISPVITPESYPLLGYLDVVWTERTHQGRPVDAVCSFGPFLARLALRPEVLRLTFQDWTGQPLSMREGRPSMLNKLWTRLRELLVEGVDLVDLMGTVELPALEILSVKGSRSETVEVVRIVDEGLNRTRLPKLERLKLASEQFNLLEPSLSLEATPSWSSLLEVGVTVVDSTGASISDIERRVHSQSRATRLPEELYFIIISLNSHFPDNPRLPFRHHSNPKRDAFHRAIKTRTSFLAVASLVCHQWHAIASPLLYQHLRPFYARPLITSLARHPNLLVRIRRISTQECATFTSLLLHLCNPPLILSSLCHLQCLQVDKIAITSLKQPLSTTFPNLQTLSLSILSSSSDPFDPPYPLILPPSLVSLSLHVDSSTTLDLLPSPLPNPISFALHLFVGDFNHYDPNNLLTPQTAQQLSSLRISLWTADPTHIFYYTPAILEGSTNLRSLSVNGIELEQMLRETNLPALERVEILQIPLDAPTDRVSFGWEFEGADEESEDEEDDPYFHMDYSIPSSLYHLLDRTRLPNLRTLAVASLDFELEPHRMGALVARHGFEMEKLGIRLVDKWGTGFGEVREGWKWGKFERKQTVEALEVDDEAGEGGEVVVAGSV